MQIMTFPMGQETDLGIRMTEIRKIESMKTFPHESPERTLCMPQAWFGLDSPGDSSEAKGISLSSFRDALLVIPRIGRILRVLESTEPLTVHPVYPFLSLRQTVEGTEAWVVDVPVLEKHLSGRPDSASPTSPSEGIRAETNQDMASSGLFQQVGQTARDIQRVLSLSGSMVESLKYMEGTLPETSHGLEVISQMTEDAAHKMMNTLENLVEENTRIRKKLHALTGEPSTMGETIAQIEKMLDAADEKIMSGFEAMAFQDLVGQNIKQVGYHLKELESRLMKILIETSPESVERNASPLKTGSSGTMGLKGVKEDGDVDQNTVDQLLSEFGF